MDSIIADFDHCQHSHSDSLCDARQFLLCPHCFYHLCFEHGQEHQEQVQQETLQLHNRAQILEQTLHDYQPIEIIVNQALQSVIEWQQKMQSIIADYTRLITQQIEQIKIAFNNEWNVTKREHTQMLNDMVIKPIDHLLQTPKRIHPSQVRELHTRFTHVHSQITNLMTSRDLLRINFDACSLMGDIKISRGHFPSMLFRSILQSPCRIPQLDRAHLLHRFDSLATDTSALGVSSPRPDNASQMLLTWAEPGTLVVFDSEKGMIKRLDIEPAFFSINDIIWSDYLNLFVIAGAALHTFDVFTDEVKQIFAPEDPQIWSIDTYRTSLFVCYVLGESPLVEHRSLPSFHIIHTYSRAQLLSNDSSSSVEVARCIRTNGQHIAMTIRDLNTCDWRVDIFDNHMRRLFKGEILGRGENPDYWCCILTPYRLGHWLVMNNAMQQETILLIDEQARVQQQIQHSGYNICMLQGEQRLLIKDQQGLAIFRI